MHIKWIGPQRYIPDLGITIDAGTVIAIPNDWVSDAEVVTEDKEGKEVKAKVKVVALGGEGSLWEKTTSGITKNDEE